jgi:hypothetical protein
MMRARRRTPLPTSGPRNVAPGLSRCISTWRLLPLLGVALVLGCRSPRSVTSPTADVRSATASRAAPPQAAPPGPPAPSLGLEAGHLHIAPKYAEAGRQLAAGLGREFPDRHFALDWVPGRLHICVQDVPYDVLVAPRDGGRPSMLLQIALLALASPEPTTMDLWISARRADGRFVQERNTWEGWATIDEHRRALLAGRRGEEPPHGLPRNLVSGDREHAAAAQALLGELTRQYPAVDFSVAWTTERLRITIQNVTFEKSTQVLYPNKPDPRKRSLWLGVLAEAASASGPPPGELWLSARREDRGWCQERWPWGILTQAYGPQTGSGYAR